MEARGLSLREVARRVQCNPGYLSNITHGKKRASEQIAVRLDDVLNAGGELAALSEIRARDDESATAGDPRGQRPAPFMSKPQEVELLPPGVARQGVAKMSGDVLTDG